MFPRLVVLLLLGFAALFAGGQGARAAGADGLVVTLSVRQPVIRGDVDVVVEATVANLGTRPQSVAPWQLPAQGDLASPFFEVTGPDGVAVPYGGPLIKRTAAALRERIVLAPGERRRFSVELSSTRDFRNGRYRIAYFSPGAEPGLASLRSTVPLLIQLEGRTLEPALPDVETNARPKARKIGFSGSCSTSRRTVINTAVTNAVAYALESRNYLIANAGGASATQRYEKWFGSLDATRYASVRANFTALHDALANQSLSFDCSCREADTYAYVYPNRPYKIYLCGAFWSAPATGTDSRAGTLIHETSHFTVVAGTDDNAYGQTAAAALAVSSPQLAVENADSHEYFAENTPSLP